MTPLGQFKAFLLDYDAYLADSDDECCFSLSEREVELILSQLEALGWATRYHSFIDTPIDLDTITGWRDNLVRKLMTGCCPDDLILYRIADDGTLEKSTDGGTTWTPAPEHDPRETATAGSNPYTGTVNEQKCAAANSAVTALKQAQDRQHTLLVDSAGLAAMIDDVYAILLLFGVFTGVGAVLATIVLVIASIVFTSTATDFAAAFTDDVWNTLLCCFYNNMGDDISVTDDQWQAIKTCAGAITPSLAGNFLKNTINALGRVGIQNALRANLGGDLDCTPCVAACPGDYFIGSPFNDPNHGHITGRDGDVIHAVMGDLGYFIMQASDIDQCCFINSVSNIVGGSVLAVAFIPCGQGYVSEGSWTFATPVGQCVSVAQWQGTAGATFDINMGTCP